MRIHARRAVAIALAITAISAGAFTLAQGITGGFEGYWGSRYSSAAPAETATLAAAPADDENARLTATAPASATAIADAERRGRPRPTDARSRLVHWNRIAIDAAGSITRRSRRARPRIFGEQLGPGRASRAMAIVHIAMFDAVNAIDGGYQQLHRASRLRRAARRWMRRSRRRRTTRSSRCSRRSGRRFDSCLRRTSREHHAMPQARQTASQLGRRAAAAILRMRRTTARQAPSRAWASSSSPANEPGKWRQDPISQVPIALGAHWGDVQAVRAAIGARSSASHRPPAHD